MTGYVGYVNRLDGATLSGSAVATGFDRENVVGWRLYDSWKPGATGSSHIIADCGSSVAADYFGLFGHNLGDLGGSVQLQHGTTDAGPWTDAFTAVEPATNRVVFETFRAVTSRYWKIILDGSAGTPTAAVIAFGSRLELPGPVPVGFRPPIFDAVETLTNEAVNAMPLGRSQVRKALALRLPQPFLDPAWVRSTWVPFIEHAQAKPFFVSWDQCAYPGDAVYAWTDPEIDLPDYSHPTLMQAELRLRALRTL